MIANFLEKIANSSDGAIVTRSCTVGREIPTPLYDSKSNYLNPCFLAYTFNIINLLLGAFIIHQTFTLIFRNRFGPHKIKYSFGSSLKLRSSGICHLVKLNSVFLHILLQLILLALNYDSLTNLKSINLITGFIVAAFLVLPLQIIEPTRSVVPTASVLLFWLFSFVENSIIFVLDLVSPYKTNIPSKKELAIISLIIEFSMTANSLAIFLLEAVVYRPTVELSEYFELNGWHIESIHHIFSDICFTWLEPLIKKIYKTNDVEVDEVPPAPIHLQYETTYFTFKRLWDESVSYAKKKNKVTKDDKKELNFSFVYILLKFQCASILKGISFDFLEMIFGFSQPFLLQKFINFFAANEVSSESSLNPPIIIGFGIAVSIFIVSTARFISFNRFFYHFFGINFALQSALESMIYNKSIKLSPESRRNKPSGDIINHLAVDITTIADCPRSVSDIACNPFRLTLCLLALYKIIGNSTWAGFIAACILVPISSKVSTAITSIYAEGLEYKDARTRLTSEILNSIKSIKLYSWEEPMLKRLDEVRNGKELVLSKRIGIYNAFAEFLWSCIPFFISSTCFIVYAYISDIPLTPSIIFPAVSLFDLLSEPILMLPNAFVAIAETKVALQRLKEFLLMDELETDYVERTYEPLKNGDISVSITESTFVWSSKIDANKDPESEVESVNNVALSDIDFSARKGQLSCIVGRVGSGKTTLIKSMLGEVPLLRSPNSSLKVNGSVAYCPQQPWILNATVKENILFGFRYDKDFYAKTIDACELESDFQVLPDGDRTVVGEKGISLSGGQKARIALARAVYSRADIYLLDDVLSAVDAHVGKNIIKKVISKEGLLASKTIILATNSVSVLSTSDEIILLKGGKITERGSFEVVMNSGSDLADLINEFGKDDSNAASKENTPELSCEKSNEHEYPDIRTLNAENYLNEEMGVATGNEAFLERVRTNNTVTAASIISFGHDYEQDEDQDIMKKTGEIAEKGEKGNIKLSVYLEYFKACNYSYMIFWVVCFCANVSATLFGSYVLKVWSEKNLSENMNYKPVLFLGLYVGLGILASFLSLFGSLVIWMYCVINGSKHFHDTMARSVLRAPMSFFETTPIGRILNRFSEDLSVIDSQLMWIFLGFGEFLLMALGMFVIIIYNLPLMAVIIFVLVIIYNELRKLFIPTSRELKRLRSACKSPIFSHLQESISGIEVIRAFSQVDRFVYKNMKNVNTLTKIDYSNNCANRWLSMRLQFISSIIVFACCLLILATVGTKNQLSVGLIGFIMIRTLSVVGTLNAIIRYWAEVETKSVAVERIIQFFNLEPEAEMIVESQRPPQSWPSKGAVKFVDYSTKYRENLDPVLKNISVEINPQEKIGIVGRTGAGKSSLTLALFRIIEACGGHIEIDGIDTSKIGLFDLRKQISIIPQESHTIEGSIRDNLDPFKQYTDEQLWRVLELAHLKEHVENMKTEKAKLLGEEKKKSTNSSSVEDTTKQYDTGLNAKVEENGSNLSSGQKQLLSLARALLNSSKILVLDEATAAVDVQTDKIIQETIRSEFKDRTILTIAHRLETILDSDRVLVLDKGKVKEFDTPEELLKNKDTIFYSLCKEGGYLNE